MLFGYKAPSTLNNKKQNMQLQYNYSHLNSNTLNTFTAIVDLSRFNNSCLKSPASNLVDLTFQSRPPLFQLKSAT